MSTYKIVGPLPVAGRLPNETLTEDDLEGLDVSFLIQTGHIAENKKGREATETPTTKEQ
jgi:hypothetical protein